jgi:hypothetical protein
LDFVDAELHLTALAFGIRVCLALKSRSATIAVYNFVLLKYDGHNTKIKSPEVSYFRA